LKCPKCVKTFIDKPELQKHLKMKHEKHDVPVFGLGSNPREG